MTVTPPEIIALDDVTELVEQFGAGQFSQGVASRGDEVLALQQTNAVQAAQLARYAARCGPLPTMRVGMNLSDGDAFTRPAAEESYPQAHARLVATYGPLQVAKVFYGPKVGFPRNSFNPAREGLVDGRRAYVSWRNSDQAGIVAGKYDADFLGLCNTIPEGFVLRFINYQEPDQTLWVAGGKPFTVDQHRQAGDRLYDLAHDTDAGKAGRIEVGDCFMEFSITPNPAAKTPGQGGRWTDAATSSKRDFLAWDAYWNSKESVSVDPIGRIRAMKAVADRLGIKGTALIETGDKPDTFASGEARAAYFAEVLDGCEAEGYDDVTYFNAVGTTGDHRIIPETPYGQPMAELMRKRAA